MFECDPNLVLLWIVLAIIFLVIICWSFQTSKKKGSKPKIGKRAGASASAGNGLQETQPSCTPQPIDKPLNNQLSLLLPIIINGELKKQKVINVPPITSSGPIQLSLVNFDQSSICGDKITLVVSTQITIPGVDLQLFAMEHVGSVVASVSLQIILIKNGNSITLDCIQLIGPVTTISLPERSDLQAILSWFNVNDAIVKLANSYLKDLQGTYSLFSGKEPSSSISEETMAAPMTVPMATPTREELAKAISDFLNRQINGLLTSDLLKNQTFKVCKTCPESTLAQINLGKEVWVEDHGCEGWDAPWGCTGCSWWASAGINSIKGLNNMRVREIKLSPNVEWTSGEQVRYYFDVIAEANLVQVCVTAAVQPCTPLLPFIGVVNNCITVPGTPVVALTGCYLEGKYDYKTQLTTFSTDSLVLGTLHIQLEIPTDWLHIQTGIGVLDGILNGLLSPFTLPVEGGIVGIQQLLNTKILKYLEPTLKDILNDLTKKIPKITLPIFVSTCKTECRGNSTCNQVQRACVCLPGHYGLPLCERTTPLYTYPPRDQPTKTNVWDTSMKPPSCKPGPNIATGRPGTCIVSSIENAQETCNADPTCIGYLLFPPNSPYLIGGNTNMAQLLTVEPQPSTEQGGLTASFYRKTGE